MGKLTSKTLPLGGSKLEEVVEMKNTKNAKFLGKTKD
jgi:hypothetical protein